MEHNAHSNANHGKQYRMLLLMVVLSFASMYILMYAMADRLENVYPNINQFYMAGLMTCPMVIIELALMRMMYPNKKLNAAIAVVSIVALVGFFFAIREQVGVGDRQFLRSMIPHHSAAILMCETAALKDPEVKKLCDGIMSGQRKEISSLKAKLNEYQK